VNNSGTFRIQSPNTTLNEVGFVQTYSDSFQNSVAFYAGGEEMLRLSPEAFYVRGKKIALDDNEARIVYNSFREWLTWQQLNRG
jgi:hypothetical protein